MLNILINNLKCSGMKTCICIKIRNFIELHCVHYREGMFLVKEVDLCKNFYKKKLTILFFLRKTKEHHSDHYILHK
jgi:hypothetical protein